MLQPIEGKPYTKTAAHSARRELPIDYSVLRHVGCNALSARQRDKALATALSSGNTVEGAACAGTVEFCWLRLAVFGVGSFRTSPYGAIGTMLALAWGGFSGGSLALLEGTAIVCESSGGVCSKDCDPFWNWVFAQSI